MGCKSLGFSVNGMENSNATFLANSIFFVYDCFVRMRVFFTFNLKKATGPTNFEVYIVPVSYYFD